MILVRSRCLASGNLPALTVEALRVHRIEQAEERTQLGLGRSDNDLVIATFGGQPIRPHDLTEEFGRIVKRAGVRRVTFHGLG